MQFMVQQNSVYVSSAPYHAIYFYHRFHGLTPNLWIVLLYSYSIIIYTNPTPRGSLLSPDEPDASPSASGTFPMFISAISL